MPTVLRSGPHRFFFFSNEGDEPPHIYVETAENYAKFWLSPVTLASAIGYNARELHQLGGLVTNNARFFLEKWHEHFGSR